MQSIYDFIVSPIDGRYDNVKDIEGKELILNTSIESHKFVHKKGVVIKTPLAYNTDIKEGDEVYIHHNIFRRWYDMKGNERNSSRYFKDDMYFCSMDQIYMYNLIPNLNYCFIKPIKNTSLFSTNSEKENFGIVKYGNSKLKSIGVEIGDVVVFTPNSEFEFIINEEKLYCMKLNDIAIKDEYQRDEEKHNSSRPTSRERTDQSSEGTDCRYGRGCDCGPTKERSCDKEVSDF